MGKEATCEELTQLHKLHKKGKRGRGKYTKEEELLYKRITGWISGGMLITVETEENIVGKKLKSSIGIGGETYVKGLVGGHAYAVKSTKEEVLNNGKENGKRLFVELVNPWGWYGRQYKWMNLTDEGKGNKKQNKSDVKKALAESTEEGKFYIELSDLVKRFKKIAYLKP